MRNNLVFKFIAIFLCAASLLGTIGGLAGVAVLTEGNLYHKSVAEVKAETIEQNAAQYASDLVRIYAGTNLGSMPESIVTDQLPWSNWFHRKFPSFGYTILDAEGNPVSQYNEGLKETATTYSFPAEGQYMYLVSTEAVTQNTEPLDHADTIFFEAEPVDFPIPQEGVEVNSIFMYDVNGQEVYHAINLGANVASRYKRTGDNAYHTYSDAWRGTPVGFIGYDQQGRLYYLSYLPDVADNTVYPQHEVAYIDLIVNDEESYQVGAMGVHSLGSLHPENGYVYFRSHAASQKAATPAIVDRSTAALTGEMEVSEVRVYAMDGTLLYEAATYEDLDKHGSTFARSVNNMSGNESVYTIEDHEGPIGCAGYDHQGYLFFNSYLYDMDQNYPAREVSRIFLQIPGGNIDIQNFDAQESLGVLERTNRGVYFRSSIRRSVETAATQPNWTVETTPDSETLVLISPDGTRTEIDIPSSPEKTRSSEAASAQEIEAVEYSVPEETMAAETVPSSASALPEATLAEESSDASESEETAGSTETAETSDATESTEVTEETQAPETEVPEDATEDATEPAETTVPASEPPVPETATPAPRPAAASETIPPETEPVLINGKPLEEYQINSENYWDSETQSQRIAHYVYLPMPEMTVEVYIDESQMNDNELYYLLDILRGYQDKLLPLIGFSALIFTIFTVYLCTAAGRKPKSDEVRAGGLNRIPLDLYLCGGCFLAACFLAMLFDGTPEILRRDLTLGCAFAVAMAFLSCLIFIGFCFAFVAQVKTPKGFWWRNTLFGHFIRLTYRFAIWLETFLAGKGFPFLGKVIRCLWKYTVKSMVWIYQATEQLLHWFGRKLSRIFRWLFHKLHRFLSLLPLTWQWVLSGFTMILLLFITVAGRFDFGIILSVLFAIGLILYGAHCFGLLSESARRMSKGDLDTKVEDKLLIGCFKDFSADLNNLADVAVVAAQKQLKSERMKTELITNVSHDIKTPLTSIINYVDLLQKPHTEEEEAQYLEVLDRQSQRLKKLIDDLMDMSKANTGTMQVDITRLDAVEAINQALGEFADKLDRARLIPVFRHDESHVPVMADGRLVWRVLSNLLSNAVKYAMPGTRLYIDLMTLEGKVVISLKNISREELNIDADELMERFVRGDDSRNTEGSGLGLNIAKSLMELQKGQLQLLVDGDLFKVTLVFPGP